MPHDAGVNLGPSQREHVRHGLLLIRPDSPRVLQTLAWRLAKLHALETVQSPPWFPPQATPGQWAEARATMLVLALPARPGCPVAVGFIVLVQQEHPAGHRTWAVRAVWVAPAWRRQGIGTLLCEAAARLVGMEPSELVWLGALTEEGEALARSIARGKLTVLL